MAKAPEVEPDTVDVYAERVRVQAGAELDGWLDRIEQELEGAADLSQFADRLYELFPELPSERFAQVMGDALVASSLAGFYESQLEQEGDA
jgi:phage gp29-like protein